MTPVANRPPTRPVNACKESGIGDDDNGDGDDANKKDISSRCSMASTCMCIYTCLHVRRVLIKLVSMKKS